MPNFFKRLFSRSPARPAAGGVTSKGSSLLAVLVQQNVKIDAHPCAVDGETTYMSTVSVWVLATRQRIATFHHDVGGSCSQCGVRRCGRHSAWLGMTLDLFKQAGGDAMLPDGFDDTMSKVLELTHKKVDMVYMLACGSCRSAYGGSEGHTTIVLVD